MKRALLVSLLFLVPAAVAVGLDEYPMTSLAEDATATWCGYCPDAYAGLDVVHAAFDWSEFISVRYYATSGDYGTAETDARISYYAVSGFPTVIFNGTKKIVGGGGTIATGYPYMEVVAGTYSDRGDSERGAVYSGSPIKIEIDSLDVLSGDISATVTMYSPTDTLSGDQIRFVLMEDDVTATHTHVTRDIINTTISLSGQGATTVFNESFNISPAWNGEMLHAVVFVQRTATKEVVQAVSNYAVPTYKVRAITTSPRSTIGTSTEVWDSDLVNIVNVGLPDTFTVSAVIDDAPAGWTTECCDDLLNCDTNPIPVVMGTDDGAQFSVRVTPTSPGYMECHLEVTSPNMAEPFVVPFTYFSDDLEAFVVDDDNGDSYEQYFTAALDSVGKSYGVWDRRVERLPYEVRQNFSLLVWATGTWSNKNLTLESFDKAFIQGFLSDGKALLLSGQEIAREMNTPTNQTFLHNYLHTSYVRRNTNIKYVDGVADDPITNGMALHIEGGDGANNQAILNEIAAYDTEATEIFHYQGDGGAAIRATDDVNGSNVVFMTFGLEGIDNAADRSALMVSAVRWLQNIIWENGFESGDLGAWSTSTP